MAFTSLSPGVRAKPVSCGSALAHIWLSGFSRSGARRGRCPWLRGRSGPHRTGQQLDVAQAVGTDEAALRIERDRNPSPETVLSATRSVPAGAVAAKRAAGSSPRSVSGRRRLRQKCVEQSLPFAELVTHREQQFAAQHRPVRVCSPASRRRWSAEPRRDARPCRSTRAVHQEVISPEQAVGRKVCEEILVIDVHDAVFRSRGVV